MAAVIGSMEFLVTQIMLVLQQAVDGFGFSPTEEQLINHLKSEEPGWRGGFCVIPTLENINDLDPWDLPARFLEKSVIPSNDREWWFICPQTPKARITRKTPCGFSWKLTGARTSINSGGQVKGHKRILTFQNGKGDWIIHEYHLIDEGGTKPSRNNVLCHLMHKQDEKADNSTARSEHEAITSEDVEQLLNEIQPMNPEGMESPGLYTFSLPRLLNLLQRELESFSTHQFTNNGGPRVPNADLSYANVQNGEGPDKSIELKWADSLINENPSDTEVQTGEEPRLEKVQQETAARNIEPCISSDEAAARAKNGQISTMKDCPSKLEPLDCAASLEETEGIKQSTFNNSHLSENCRFSPSLDDAAQAKNGQISTMKDCRSKLEPLDWVASLEETEGVKQSSFNSSHLSENRRFSRSLEDAAQAKGLEHEEHKLAGNSPKRRRLEVSD